MDEPTNHLDSSGRQRLYDWVEKCHSTLLVVSHDRTLPIFFPKYVNWRNINSLIMAETTNSHKEQKTLDAGSLTTAYRRKRKALRIARKVARETAERRDKQNVRGEES